ncbi:MAG: helical backbone metal receptor [Endomicrobium sp.]|jgi:iron complex transport system substrate-binding protein|nr:helical backbone metal receptor [Endomicrobium sp.]
MKKWIQCIYFFLVILQSTCLGINAKEYRRIISLAPSITRTLYELKMESYIIGITFHCPKGTTNKHIVGTMLDPNIEKIMLLKPDLIILTQEGNTKDFAKKLIRFGFEIYIINTTNNFQDLCNNYFLLASKINREKLASKIIHQAKTMIINVYNNINIAYNKRIFWEIGRYPLYTAGSKSFVNDYSHYSKTNNIYSDINKSYFPIGIEDLIKRNPDIIIHTKYNNVVIDTFWKQYTRVLNAVKNKKIFMIDNKSIFSPTPLTFVTNLQILVNKIYEKK